MSEPILFSHGNTNMMEWRVMLASQDDSGLSADEAAAAVERCVSEFRKRLHEERARGLVPIGYGPVVK